MIRVRYRLGHSQTTENALFKDDSIMKVLSSGALKVSKQIEIDVPMLGADDEELSTKPELTLGIFNCEYVVIREANPDETTEDSE